MAYLVRIGAFPENVSGVGSRGYHAYRRRCPVITIWGGVEVRTLQKFYWVQTTQHKIYRRASERAAVKCLRDILLRMTTGEGYSRFPASVPIRRTAKSARSTRMR
jgi:hypothetical protein